LKWGNKKGKALSDFAFGKRGKKEMDLLF